MRRLLRILALVLLLLGAGAYWLAGREAILHWAFDKVAAATQGQLQFDGLGGNLLGAIRVDRVRFSNAKAVVVADGVVLDFSLAALLQRRLAIDRLQADSLFVKLVRSDEPLEPPTSLALPVGIEVSRLQIGLIDIRRGDFSLLLRNLQARFASTGGAHSLALQGIDLPWGRVSGTLNLSGHAPFVLNSTAELIPPNSDTFMPALQLDVHGQLAEIRTRLKTRSIWVQAAASAVILPFQPVQLKGVEADLTRLDLQAMDPSLPRTSLGGRLTASQSRQTELTGELELLNRIPGTLTQGSLPLTRLAARFILDPEQLVLENLQFGMRLGATLTGKARLDADGIDAQLAGTALNLQAFDARMTPTRLASKLDLQADPNTQRLVATMADARQRYEIHALRQGNRISLQNTRIRNTNSRLDLQGELTTQGTWPFSGEAKLASFDPSVFGHFPSARINASVTGRGQFKPDWQVQLKAA
ncbi:MAG: hypothetical protein GC183_01945, partial [Thiobacillus sp.]|nr:hypothetical protein [Thiobacillus sp.]